jgi:enoyl-CoA hydratase
MTLPTLTHLRVDLLDEGAIALLTFDRPKALNALNPATIDDLAAAVAWITGAGVRAVVLTGAGDRAFVAGADITAMTAMNAEEAEAFSKKGSATLRALEQLPIPVLAAVNGFALGGGCELAMACDILWASDNARFGQPEVNLGLIAGFGGTQRLPRRIGYGPAMEILLSGNPIDAAEALRLGLVNRVLPQAELLEGVLGLARTILSRGPVAVRQTKALVQRAPDVDLDAGLLAESQAFGGIFHTEDFREGTTAFVEKRKAAFQGR